MRRNTSSAANDLPESEAIRLAQQGDSAAFEMLYRRHSRRVYALCLRMSGNLSDAEDLTQETFLMIFRKIQSFRGESAFSTWLHRVTVNTVLMGFRKKELVAESLDEPCEAGDEGSAPLQLGEQDLRLSGALDRVNLERAIRQLSPGCRQMFVLHDIEGYLHDEIAEIAGCSVGNSKSQLHKARLRLREILRNEICVEGQRRLRRARAAERHPRERVRQEKVEVDSFEYPAYLQHARAH
jgi:RNA polymerase sigma-70 factor (ECF subfamily)